MSSRLNKANTRNVEQIDGNTSLLFALRLLQQYQIPQLQFQIQPETRTPLCILRRPTRARRRFPGVP